MMRLSLSVNEKEGLDFDFEAEDEANKILQFVHYFQIPQAFSTSITDLSGTPYKDVIVPHEITISTATGLEMFRMDLCCSEESGKRLADWLNRHAICIGRDWQTCISSV